MATDYTKTQILQMTVDYTMRGVERTDPGRAGIDLWEVAAATQDEVIKDLDKGTFPMDHRAHGAIRRRWDHALRLERHARAGWHVGLEATTMMRARKAVDAVRDAGAEPTVESAYQAGQKLYGKQKGPGKEVLQHLLWGRYDIDAPASEDGTPMELAGTHGLPGDDGVDVIEVASAFIPFMPTPQTYRDLESLIAARAANRKDDGGIDCQRLDLVALLRLLTKKYDNGKEVPAIPPRTQKKLLGVTDEGLAALYAELDAAMEVAAAHADEYRTALDNAAARHRSRN